MASEWVETTLGSLLKFANGRSSPSRSDDYPVRVYGSNGVIGYCQETNADAETIIVGRVGSYCGSTYLSRDACWVTDNAIKASSLPGNDSRFLFYLLDTLDLNSRASGSGQPLLNQSILSSIDVVVPPLPEQKAIAHILGSLDDKIELNRRMNATLEGMAQALFKSWFVDFDPVIDNALEAGNPIPEEFAARARLRQGYAGQAETRRRALSDIPTIGKKGSNVRKNFPDSFQTSELGPIPTGWEIESIYELIDVTYGAPFKAAQFVAAGDGVPVIRIRDLKTGTPQNWTKEDHPKKTLIKAGDIVVGMDAEFRATIWHGENGYLNQRLFLASPKNDCVNNFFIQHTLRPQLEFEENTQVGTTVAHLGKKEINKFTTLTPSDSILREYTRTTTPILDRLVQNYNSQRMLSKLRDTLLPKLISGELRIEDAEKMVGGGLI